MRRDPAISLRGALQILGHHDRPWLERLNGLLGGVILAAGPIPAAVGALWGWVDQKNEATALLRSVLDGVSDRIRPSYGLMRHELVVAAHSTIVLTAFFDALRQDLGDTYDEALITEAEKVSIGTGAWRTTTEPLVRRLYTSELPAPSALCGFEENVENVQFWCLKTAAEVQKFLGGLHLAQPRTFDPAAVALAGAEGYRSLYLALATTVPEFGMWANLGEHAATRSAMARLEGLLSVASVPSRDLREVVRDTNRAVLGLPVIDVGTDGYGTGTVFPAVQDIFVTPRFRVAEAGPQTTLSGERWWANLPIHEDLDLVLARHFSTGLSTRLPLLLLGHPGAGKSLLVKVLAARLPDEGYTVVRVPLRSVEANGVITRQIQQALDLSTHQRVRWPDLADQSTDTIRVVLLDGLDELLQATTHDRAGYLQEVAEFQRVEAVMGRPVAVVVTSRTLVIDRVAVPEGTPVVKLEEFDEKQIRQWVAVWNGHNGPMPAEFALNYPDLAGQPLLLLMLALYHADSPAPVEGKLSKAELYERLLDTYARREVTKKAGRVLHGREAESALEEQLRRLSTAALGMFNRGRQDITEADLGADLESLGEPADGDRVLGEFFFVHAAEARVGSVRRCYEFLHATFGEYLVAARVMEVLRDVAEGAFGRRREHDPEDDLLFALLSHQPLAIQWPILGFISGRLRTLGQAERDRVVRTLDLLIRTYRGRKPSRDFGQYRPLPHDAVRVLAAYSANLVLLRLWAGFRARVPLTALWPENPLGQWHSTVSLWEAGMDAQGFQSMLTAFRYSEGVFHAHVEPFVLSVPPIEVQRARIRGERDLERRLRTGLAIHDQLHYLTDTWFDEFRAEDWLHYTEGWLMAAFFADARYTPELSLEIPSGVSDEARRAVSVTAHMLLEISWGRWTDVFIMKFVEWLVRLSDLRDESVLRRTAELCRNELPLWLSRAMSEDSESPRDAAEQWLIRRSSASG
ncbi:MAG: AAA family ATPase [Umezawaea sp.]